MFSVFSAFHCSRSCDRIGLGRPSNLAGYLLFATYGGVQYIFCFRQEVYCTCIVKYEFCSRKFGTWNHASGAQVSFNISLFCAL